MNQLLETIILDKLTDKAIFRVNFKKEENMTNRKRYYFSNKYLDLLNDDEIKYISKKSTEMHYPKKWYGSMFYEIMDYEYKKVGGRIERVDYSKNKKIVRLKIIKLNEETMEEQKVGYVSISDYNLHFTNLLINNSYKQNKTLIAQDFPIMESDSKENLHFQTSQEEQKQEEISQNAFVSEMTSAFGRTYLNDYNNYINKIRTTLEFNGVKTK